MKQKDNKPTLIKSGLDKYRAKSAHIEDTGGQTTSPEHYGSGAIYASRKVKEE